MAASDKLRKFRSGLALLKRKGLLDKSLNVRRAIPDQSYKRKTLRSIIDKYDDIISGKVTPVKLPPASVKAYRKQGFRTTKGMVLVEHTATQRVVRRGKYFAKTPKRLAVGLEYLELPVPFHELEQWFDDVRKNENIINRMKKNNEYFGFEIYGGSTDLYSDITTAINTISGYSSMLQAAASTKHKQLKMYQNLAIVRVIDDSKWTFPASRRNKQTQSYNRKAQKKYRDKMKKHPKGLDYLEKQAQDQLKHRNSMTETKKEEYRRKARERAKRSRENRKN